MVDGLKRFAIDGKASLLEEADLGLFNGMLTTNLTFRDVLSFRGLYAPPYVSSDFQLEVRLFGEKVRTDEYFWHPFQAARHGRINDVEVHSETVLCDGLRAALLRFTLENRTARAVRVPLEITIDGRLDRNEVWDFSRPQSATPTRNRADERRLVKANAAGAVAVATDLPDPAWEDSASLWKTTVSLPAKAKRTFHLAVAIGPKSAAARDAQQLVHSPARFIEEAQAAWQRKAQDLFEKLPTLHAQDKRLEAFYNRSLLHLLLNQWRVPEFKLQPYYSTGSMIGGCACSYLWDFGNNHHVFSLYDPAAQREHIKAFLSIDLTKHFAFLPITGQAYGPWYYINQEKIIFHIYHYVLNTGDVRFLFEKVNGKTIVDHVVEQALVGDDLSKDAVLVDYGDGNHHLELRREYRYDHVLPDMNGRRYAYYLAADELCRMAGKATVNLRNRAEAIKRLLRRTLWSPKHNWFFWLDAKGKKHLRYTVQMFKLIGSPVLDADQERGLLSHLNEDEFLSDYGLHSMSKKDPAYDQVDIDNGGGGCCSCFIGPIVKKLYRAGRPDRAEDILRRVLWWGDRLPYWSDSLVANRKDYRRDTPLQNAIGSVSAAQGIMFGMFGLNVDVDGRITVNPRPPRFSPRIALHGLRLRGRRMDLLVNGNSFTVRADDRTVRSALGRPVILERL